MKLKELAAKPQLVKCVLDDKEVVKEYGEQPLSDFIRFSVTASEDQNYSEMVEFCSELILDEDGKKVMTEGLLLPNSILIKCINSVVEQLGK